MACRILQGDALLKLPEIPSESVHCCVTSPPYWGLRDYGVAGQLGLERTPEEYVSKMVAVFREVKRVLRSDGTLWLNIGDTYAGSWGAMSYAKGEIAHRRFGGDGEKIARPVNSRLSGDLKPKDLVGIPWLLAFALRADGWYLRSDIIWHKPNPMPESVTDRPTKAHEYIFLLSRSERYFYDADAIAEPLSDATVQRDKSPRGRSQNGGGSNESMSGYDYDRRADLGNMQSNPDGRNKRSVWTVTTKPFSEAHFATFPPDLIEPCIKAGCPEGGTVLDPFSGAGTTGLVATRFNRNYIGIELNPEYIAMSTNRIVDDAPLFNSVSEFPTELGPDEIATGVE